MLETEMRYEYDKYGNIIYVNDLVGDVNSSADDREISLRYVHRDQRDLGLTTRNLVSLPSELEVTDSSGSVLRLRRGSYDANGNLISHRAYLTDGASEAALTTLSYDGTYGNAHKRHRPSRKHH